MSQPDMLFNKLFNIEQTITLSLSLSHDLDKINKISSVFLIYNLCVSVETYLDNKTQRTINH